MDAVEYHFRDTPDIIIWFDMFSNNQHKAVDLDFDWWCTIFKSAIKDFGHMVGVLSPWNQPTLFKRGWCLHEFFCCISTNSKFVSVMSPNELLKFWSDIKNSPFLFFDFLFINDCREAQCLKENDRNAIFNKIIESGISFAAINGILFLSVLDNFLLYFTTPAVVFQKLHLEKATIKFATVPYKENVLIEYKGNLINFIY